MENIIKYAYLDREYQTYKRELDNCFTSVMAEGSFILRQDVNHFEQAVCDRLNVKYCIGVNSGTDALRLSIGALELPKGSKVICPAHCFVSAINALVEFELVPVFVDVNLKDHNISLLEIKKIVDDTTSAILVVHMNGISAQISDIVDFAEEHSLKVIEDTAQAFDSAVDRKFCGTFGDVGTLSMHPLKTLNAAGDAGAVITNSKELAAKVVGLRNIGQRVKGTYDTFGYNSRLDNMQAKILLEKLRYFDSMSDLRQKHTENYAAELEPCGISFPKPLENERDYRCSFSNVVIVTSKAAAIRQAFEENSIQYLSAWNPATYKLKHLLHYTNEYKNFPATDLLAKDSINLPAHALMTDKERNKVCDLIKKVCAC